MKKKKCFFCRRVIHKGGIEATAYKANKYGQTSVIGKRYFHKICRFKMLRALKRGILFKKSK